jgi:uncharacterized protein (DUF305 family)
MDTKALLFGIIGFLFGGLVVSFAATQLEDTASASEMTMSAMSEQLADLTEDEFDAGFITSMIEHHQGAIAMAKLAESRAKHEEIKELSQDIINAQRGEIAQMRQWQQRWGYATEHSNGGH